MVLGAYAIYHSCILWWAHHRRNLFWGISHTKPLSKKATMISKHCTLHKICCNWFVQLVNFFTWYHEFKQVGPITEGLQYIKGGDSNGFTALGCSNGQICLTDSRQNFKVQQILPAHAGGLSGMDICGGLLATCGWGTRQGHLVPDTIVKASFAPSQSFFPSIEASLIFGLSLRLSLIWGSKTCFSACIWYDLHLTSCKKEKGLKKICTCE